MKINIVVLLVVVVAYSCKKDMTTTSNSNNNSNNNSTVTDIDGNIYHTVTIGTQTWMVENLRTTHYRNGDPIPNVTVDAQWISLTTGAWCWNHNDAQYENPYGKLYNWYTVSDPRNVCPNGWHVPTDAEWNLLVKYLDPAADTSCAGCYQSTIAGGMMKSTGTQYWASPNTGADNQSGFSGLPGGFRNSNGSFESVGNYGNWWTSSTNSTTYFSPRFLCYLDGIVGRCNSFDLADGFSVRCLRD